MSWYNLCRLLVRCLPTRDRLRRGAELDGVLHETQLAVGVGPRDAISMGTLVVRRWGSTAVESLPLLLCGLPIAILPFMFIAFVYETHFRPWDLMEDTPSSDPFAHGLRWAYDNLFVIPGALCVIVGGRCIQYLRRGDFWFPSLVVCISLIGMSQSSLFIERTAWEFRNLRPSDVDSVSGWSILMAVLSIGLPVAFLAIDIFVSRRSGRRPLDPLRCDGRMTEPVLPSVHTHPQRSVGWMVMSIGLVFAAMAVFMARGLVGAYRAASNWDRTGPDPLEDVMAVWAMMTLPGLVALVTIALALNLLAVRSSSNVKPMSLSSTETEV